MEKNIDTTEGTIRYGWLLGKKGTPENLEIAGQIKADLAAHFEGDTVYNLVDTNVTHLDDSFHFLLEITGPELYPRQEVQRLQDHLEQKFNEPIVLYAWSRIEVVHGPKEGMSVKELNAYFSDRQKENLPDMIPLILEAARR